MMIGICNVPSPCFGCRLNALLYQHIYQHHCLGQSDCPWLPCVPIASFHSWTFHWSIFGCSVPWPLQRTLLPQNQSHHGKIWQDVSQGNMQFNDVTLHVTWGYMRLHEVICRQGKLWHTHTYKISKTHQTSSSMINGTASTTLCRGDLYWIEYDCFWLILPMKVH